MAAAAPSDSTGAAPAVVGGAVVGPVIEAGCSYDARQLKGKDGDLFRVSCPAGCAEGEHTRGTGVYSAHSAICRAGIHAGAIPATGGTLMVRLEPGRPAYRGSEQNGIKSSDYNAYDRSFAVVTSATAQAAPAVTATPADGASAAATVIEAGCSFDARTLKGKDGDTFKITCPAGCAEGEHTRGTGVYSAHSAICRAGIHAGAIPATGGTLTVKLEPGRPAYRGSVQNGIKSSDYNDYDRSFAVVLPGAAAPAADPNVIEAGCSFDARTLKGKDGDTFKVACPAGCAEGEHTRGTGVYSAHSAICRAGIHAGAIPATGGTLTVKLEPGRRAYRGSVQNGIKSSDYNDYDHSFAVVLPGAAAPAADPNVIEAGCSFDARTLKGKDGDTFKVACPAGCAEGEHTRGTDVYSAHSAICRAGIHAGAIAATGGTLTVKLEPGRPAYRGSEQNGIKSSDYNAYDRSFSIVKP